MIQKLPRQLKFLCQIFRQRFHAEGFGCLVAGGKNVPTQFLRQRITPVWAFTRDESVHAFSRGESQVIARAAGHDPDTTANRWAGGNHTHSSADGSAESQSQLVT